MVTAVNDALAGRDDLLEASERHYNLDHKIDIINEAATEDEADSVVSPPPRKNVTHGR